MPPKPKFVRVKSEEELNQELISHANVLILFTKDGCPHCDKLKKEIENMDLSGNVEVVEVPFDDAKTYDLFENLDIDKAPTGLMIKECDFEGEVVGSSEDSIKRIERTYKDARDACRLDNGKYVPIAQLVREDEE